MLIWICLVPFRLCLASDICFVFFLAMADVMSHGGDAGGDPPHSSGSRLPGACESIIFLVLNTFVWDLK